MKLNSVCFSGTYSTLVCLFKNSTFVIVIPMKGSYGTY